jgi:hypothetical protein
MGGILHSRIGTLHIEKVAVLPNNIDRNQCNSNQSIINLFGNLTNWFQTFNREAKDPE